MLQLLIKAVEQVSYHGDVDETVFMNLLNIAQQKEWNLWRLSGYELAGNDILLQHGSSGDWGIEVQYG